MKVIEDDYLYALRNEILEEIRRRAKAAPPLKCKNHDYWMEISLLAAKGACSQEVAKVSKGLTDILEQMKMVSKVLAAQIERLDTNQVFAYGEVDWKLVEAFFSSPDIDIGIDDNE